MRKGIIVNFKRIKLLDYVTLNKIFLILVVIFITGITLGSTIFLRNNLLSKKAALFFSEYIQTHLNNSFFKKFIICIARYAVVLVVYFLSGVSLFGVAVTPFITAWQGIIIGRVIAHLYANYGIGGIAFNAIVFVPPIAIFVVTCFFAAKHAINFSIKLANLTMPKTRPMNLCDNFKEYCGKYVIFVGISVICALFEIILNLLFLNYFKFY